MARGIPGQITITNFTIGSLDLVNDPKVFFHGFEIFENITDPFGHPVAEFNISDPDDKLNKNRITGSYDENPISISFRNEYTGDTQSFQFKMYSVYDLTDGAGNNNRGSLHSKDWKVKAVQPELYLSQKIKEKTYNGPTTKHVEDMFKEMGSDKPVNTDPSSEPRDINYNGEKYINHVKNIVSEHKAVGDPSSAYTLFQRWTNGKPEIIQSTYYKLLQQSPVATLTERTDINTSRASAEDIQNNIIYSKFSPSWSFNRPMENTVKRSFNLSTFNVTDEKYKQQGPKPKNPAWIRPATYADENGGNSGSIIIQDKINNSQPHNTADGIVEKNKFMAHMSQGEAIIEIPANPKITLGSMVRLQIPKKTDDNALGGEGQMNAEALVVAIRHIIRPDTQQPRYTMVLHLAKGGMEKGGSTA